MNPDSRRTCRGNPPSVNVRPCDTRPPAPSAASLPPPTDTFTRPAPSTNGAYANRPQRPLYGVPGRRAVETARDGPWGRGHLALAMRRKAHRFEELPRPCAPTGACEGKMPSPPKGPSPLQVRARSLRRRKAVHRASTSGCGQSRAPGASHWGRGHLALAMRRKAHRFDRLPRPGAPSGACEGKMPSPPRGRRRCKCAPEACAAEKQCTGRPPAAAASHGPRGRATGGKGILPSPCAARRIGSIGYLGQARLAARARARCPRPQGAVAAASARQKPAPQKSSAPGVHQRCGQSRTPGASHWGRGHLALAMRRKAHRSEGLPRLGAPGGACEGKMPSPPRGRRRCEGVPGAGAPEKQCTGRLPATVDSHGPWGRATGGEGILPSLCAARRIGFEGLPQAMRAYRRVRGQDALAPKGPSPLRGRAGSRRPRKAVHRASASDCGQPRALGASH